MDGTRIADIEIAPAHFFGELEGGDELRELFCEESKARFSLCDDCRKEVVSAFDGFSVESGRLSFLHLF